MKNILKLARQTVDGLRALPKIGQILTERSDEHGLAVDLATAQERLGSALDVYRAALAEAKARIATLVESNGKLRLEIDDLRERNARIFEAGRDAAKAADLEQFIGDEQWAWAREYIETLKLVRDGALDNWRDIHNDRALIVKERDALAANLQSANLEIARLSSDAANADAGNLEKKHEPLTYSMATECANGKLQAIYTRSDGLQAKSSWWGVDDGSAEAEASERLRGLERSIEDNASTSQGCTCHISPPCEFCVSRPAEYWSR